MWFLGFAFFRAKWCLAIPFENIVLWEQIPVWGFPLRAFFWGWKKCKYRYGVIWPRYWCCPECSLILSYTYFNRLEVGEKHDQNSTHSFGHLPWELLENTPFEASWDPVKSCNKSHFCRTLNAMFHIELQYHSWGDQTWCTCLWYCLVFSSWKFVHCLGFVSHDLDKLERPNRRLVIPNGGEK